MGHGDMSDYSYGLGGMNMSLGTQRMLVLSLSLSDMIDGMDKRGER